MGGDANVHVLRISGCMPLMPMGNMEHTDIERGGGGHEGKGERGGLEAAGEAGAVARGVLLDDKVETELQAHGQVEASGAGLDKHPRDGDHLGENVEGHARELEKNVEGGRECKVVLALCGGGEVRQGVRGENLSIEKGGQLQCERREPGKNNRTCKEY